jgi:WD40 repeat protein
VSVDGGEVSDLEELELPLGSWLNFDTAGCAAAGASSPDGHHIYHASVGAEARLVGRQQSKIVRVELSTDGERIATLDSEGRPRIWLATPSEHAFQTLSAGSSDFDGGLTFSADGALLLGRSWTNQNVMWNLTGPPDADPVELGVQLTWGGSFDPTNRWLVLKQPDFRLRPLRVDASFLIPSDNPRILGLAFDRAGDHLFSADLATSILRWPLTGESGDRLEKLYSRSNAVTVRRSPRFHRLAIDPQGRFLAAAGDIATGPGATIESGVTLVPLDGGGPVGLVGSEDWPAFDVAIDPEGRRVAAGAYVLPEVRIWELESGAMSRFELEEPPWPGGTISPAIGSVRFLPDGRLLISTLAGSLWRLDPATGETERAGDEVGLFDLSADGRFLLSSFKGRVAFHDLHEGTVRALASHSDPSHDSDDWTAVALDPSGTVAISANNRPEAGRLGVVRVGPVTGEEPHLLFGPPSQVWALAVSPDGGTIAAATEDGTIQLWPMPDAAEPALHTLPLDELLAHLGASTNARVVRDDALPEGYRVEWQPITRWPTHPED